MTPYVVHEDDKEELNNVPQKPKSIMVTAASTNGYSNGVNGTSSVPKTNGCGSSVNGSVKSNGCVKTTVNGHTDADEAVETPDSLPSRSSVSGRSIIGNGKNGRSGALKR